MISNFYKFSFLATLSMLLFSLGTNAQCTDWINPSPTTGFTNFSDFGGAPCDDGTGCTSVSLPFEIFAAEAYEVENFIAGGEYSLDVCEGAGAGSWEVEFTIIAPSGAVDAFGTGEPDGCTIFFTASESGTYLIVFNEAGSCGGGSNTGVDNGIPRLSCLFNAACPPETDICNAGTLTTTDVVSLCDASETFELTAINDTIPTGGVYALLASNNLGGTGGDPSGVFAVPLPSADVDLDSDLSGLLSYFSLPPLSGPWVFRGAVGDAAGILCAVTADSLIVFFGTESPEITTIESVNPDELTATVTGGVPPYTYLWDDPMGQTTETAVGLESGVLYTVFVQDANGCVTQGESMITLSNTNTISTLSDYNISPNPSNGNFSLNLSLEQSSLIEVNIMDVTGGVIETASQQANQTTFDFALSTAPAGVYFVNIIVGDEYMTEKIVITK